MQNKFYIAIAARMNFEQMMDETREISREWWETHTFACYGDWDDFILNNLEIAVPVLNDAMKRELIADLIKHGFSKASVKKLDISCSYYQVLDYTVVFTAKVSSDKKTLSKLVDLINTFKIYRVMTPEPEFANEPQEIIPDYLKPCRLWDRTHKMPVWYIEIFEEEKQPTADQKAEK